MSVDPTFRIDLGPVERSFRAMSKRANALAPVFRELRRPMQDDQREHGQRQEGPDGKWPARAASTLETMRRSRSRRRPMGRLPQSMDYRAGNFGLVGRSRVPWELAHAAGDKVGRGAQLPVRVVHWLSDGLVKRAVGRIERALREAFGG